MGFLVKRQMSIMLISVGTIFGCIFIFQGFKHIMMKRAISANKEQIVTVSSTVAQHSFWQPQIKATGSTRAVLGVNVTTELSGMVQYIYFTPGSMVEKDTILAQLNVDPEVAQLHVYEAQQELARITYERDKLQYAAKAISKATLDTDYANLKTTEAQVAGQAAIIMKKTIRAPFTGRLGISAIYPGQFLNPGDKITSLETLDPIYVDFYVPQQQLPKLKVGQEVNITSDSFPGQNFRGKVTTIDSAIDPNTRNVEIEATIPNPKLALTPGMYTYVTVTTGEMKNYLTLPQAAISFNSYGDIVYVLTPDHKDKNDNQIYKAQQRIVSTGETRGDQIAILSGLKIGETVVTSGQLKLRNGSLVMINNTVQPASNPSPKAVDE